jgi:hypothetical protein
MHSTCSPEFALDRSHATGRISPSGPGCAKTGALNLLVESSSQFGQSENQKCWRRLSEEGNRENGSTLSGLAHVFTRPGPKAAIPRKQGWRSTAHAYTVPPPANGMI